ncbi:MAG: NAD(P)/FAD-dependent oxidoreductase [Chloroflexi bacterium]|nr:NAD(P)/FAD-dependent oxidoreductase [Chloroflexota bacterium]MDA1228522.1 NAD(P)/FAD-dependent oxidoreductase [Chloroflexota bacterium]
MKIGIIGAGAAGLAAAYRLGKQGHKVVVYEQAPFVGGQASTFDVGGARLERGYHHWFTSDTDIIELTEEVGLGHQIQWIDSTVGTLYDGKIYDFVTPLDLLKFKPLSLVDRFRLGLMTLYLQRQKNYRKYEGITAHEWLSGHVGRGGYEAFWEPMLRGKFGEEFYKQIGMVWVWGKVQTRVKSRGKSMIKEKLGYPIGSFGEIFEVLADKIRGQGGEVHLSASVEQVLTADGRATGLRVAIAGGPAMDQDFDAIISTTPSYLFPKLVPDLPVDYLAKLTNARYMGAVLLVLVMDRPLSRVYWLNVADRSIPFVAVIEHTNLISPARYGGKHVVYLSNYLSTDSPMYKMDRQELLDAYVPHLKKINPGFDTSWIEESYHHRIGAAQPIVGVNYSSQIPDHRTPIRNLYLANTTQIYPEDRGTNYSVRMGNQVADMVSQDLA